MNRSISRHLRTATIGVLCASAGAGAGVIATAGAATPNHTPPAGKRGRGLAPRAVIRHTVHADLVVATKAGFVTVTVDRGTVRSVSGHTLTLVEGTPRRTYRTTTLTLPATTRVRDNRRRTTLDHVTPGQRAVVVQGPHRALVIARTPKAG